MLQDAHDYRIAKIARPRLLIPTITTIVGAIHELPLLLSDNWAPDLVEVYSTHQEGPPDGIPDPSPSIGHLRTMGALNYR